MKETTRNEIKAFKNNCKNFFVSIINFLKNTPSPIDFVDTCFFAGIGFITQGVAELFGHYSYIVCGVLVFVVGLITLWRAK